MQLNEILEENSVRSISEKTNISEENLEALFDKEFSMLKKVKTMGFISIIEREYRADLSALRKEANSYYEVHQEDGGVMLDIPVPERRKGRSRLKIIVVIILFGVASWYFITQFDQEKLRGLFPFNEEKVTQSITETVDNDPNLSIEHAIAEETPAMDEGKSESAVSIVSETNQSHE